MGKHKIAVIGLGRFGSAIAKKLSEKNAEVLADKIYMKLLYANKADMPLNGHVLDWDPMNLGEDMRFVRNYLTALSSLPNFTTVTPQLLRSILPMSALGSPNVLH